MHSGGGHDVASCHPFVPPLNGIDRGQHVPTRTPPPGTSIASLNRDRSTVRRKETVEYRARGFVVPRFAPAPVVPVPAVLGERIGEIADLEPRRGDPQPHQPVAPEHREALVERRNSAQRLATNEDGR